MVTLVLGNCYEITGDSGALTKLQFLGTTIEKGIIWQDTDGEIVYGGVHDIIDEPHTIIIEVPC